MSDLILPESARSYSMLEGSTSKRSDMGVPIIRTSSTSKVRRFMHQAFWAEGGRIYIEDEKTGEFQSQSLEKFAKVVEALAGIGMTTYDAHIRAKIRQMTRDALEVIIEAKEQGDPHNPAVLAAKARLRQRQQVSFGGVRPYPAQVTERHGIGSHTIGKPWKKHSVN